MHQILLIRHGEAAKSATDADPGLTLLGQRQAENLADDLDRQFPRGEGVRLVSSPKTRALQTAIPVAGRWQMQVDEEYNVIEIPSPLGMPLAERGQWIRGLLHSRWDTLTPEQGHWREGITDYLLRLTSTTDERRFHTTLVFCHFMVINSVVAAIRNDLQVAQFYPDYTSQTRLAIEGGKLHLVQLGRETNSGNLIQ
ncbi:histidine phosphatase family protein [Microbulbifer pacificus]|uniref:Histidine phosphatase family protein n=1 Tax=Microbulbifer pacificus TaxID=407164 RepID=A0AAU0MYA4_9GAMM|nr:histidine phosphatase family protein [Microbulbifer pacificus]WOX05190.1 histidine phosphatase family protein [Microbulbifer pacificus]